MRVADKLKSKAVSERGLQCSHATHPVLCSPNDRDSVVGVPGLGDGVRDSPRPKPNIVNKHTQLKLCWRQARGLRTCQPSELSDCVALREPGLRFWLIPSLGGLDTRCTDANRAYSAFARLLHRLTWAAVARLVLARPCVGYCPSSHCAYTAWLTSVLSSLKRAAPSNAWRLPPAAKRIARRQRQQEAGTTVALQIAMASRVRYSSGTAALPPSCSFVSCFLLGFSFDTLDPTSELCRNG
jgi:hypothetical protein